MPTASADRATDRNADRAAELAELAELLARTALGDRQAFRTLYECSSSHLLGVILRIERNRERAKRSVWLAAQGAPT